MHHTLSNLQSTASPLAPLLVLIVRELQHSVEAAHEWRQMWPLLYLVSTRDPSTVSPTHEQADRKFSS
jgi:hypothetical protein